MSDGMLFPGKQRLATVMLHRVGQNVKIKREVGSAAQNDYGKVEDGERNYETIDHTVAYRMFRSGDSGPRESRVSGGRVNVNNPRIAAPRDTRIEEDDRIVFTDTGRTYHADERIPRQTHYEFRSTLVNG